MNFSIALGHMRSGLKVARKTWKNGEYAYIQDGRLKKIVGCKVAHYTHAALGWTPTENDILAEDWRTVS